MPLQRGIKSLEKNVERILNDRWRKGGRKVGFLKKEK